MSQKLPEEIEETAHSKTTIKNLVVRLVSSFDETKGDIGHLEAAKVTLPTERKECDKLNDQVGAFLMSLNHLQTVVSAYFEESTQQLFSVGNPNDPRKMKKKREREANYKNEIDGMERQYQARKRGTAHGAPDQ